jgi:hypothetical protein
MHESRPDVTAGRVEGPRGGLVGVERIGPIGLQIDGVDEDEAGALVQRAGREQPLDLVVGVGGDPGVDPPGGSVGVGAVVDQLHRGAVVAGERVEERWGEAESALTPERVRDVELDAVALAGGER